MEDNQTRRIWVIVGVMAAMTLVISGRLVWLQLIRTTELSSTAERSVLYEDSAKPERGYIYDRNGAILAAPSYDYWIGVDRQYSISLDPDHSLKRLETLSFYLMREMSIEISQLTGLLVDSPVDRTWVEIARNVPADLAEQLWDLKQFDAGEPDDEVYFPEITIDPQPRRMYPQGALMCHILGYVDADGYGHHGLEAYYERELAGQARSFVVSRIPTTPRQDQVADRGSDLVLTIDRTVQATVERHLRQAIEKYGARSGTIIVMNPKTGAILAMASDPCYEPERYSELTREESQRLMPNPAISQQYEPGSIMKLITMSAALDSGAVTAASTFADGGTYMIGGQTIRNASNGVYGMIDMTQTLMYSVNTATVWAATRMTPETYYTYLERFGFGRPTGVDLALEIGGQVIPPGSATWTEGIWATNAFGQSISVTPLQMLSAISAIANGGVQMRPYLVEEMWQDDELVFQHEPYPQSQPISEQTARTITGMAMQAAGLYVEVEGYSLAGKTGTAQIPIVEEGGVAFYHPTDTIGSFVGWLPADDPAFTAIIKLDVPTASEWGSMTSAPTFGELAKDLVVLLNVPPDAVRQANR